MAGFSEYTQYDGLGLAELVAKGDVTPLELADAAIAAIEQANPAINAVIHPMFEHARSRAQEPLSGPFAGVPCVLKDLESPLAGFPMTSGARFYRDWSPPRNSALVDRFLAAGLVAVGKANCSELGIVPSTEPKRHGPTRNPWNPEHTAGGSSGGTAAAVAARLVPLGSGGDGGGSIRIPAACCGIFGLKPTRGRTPDGPDRSEGWNAFSIQFGLSRSVRDSAALLDAVAGSLPGDWHPTPRPATPFLDEVGRDPGRLRIAFSAQPFLPATLHPDCQLGLDATVRKLTDLGHELVEARPELDGRAFARHFLTIVGAHTAAAIDEAQRALGRKARRGDFEDRTWLSAELGRTLRAGEYVQSIQTLQRLVRPVHAFFERCDVFLCPTCGLPPGKLGFLDAHGIPALAGKLARRLPIGPVMRIPALLDQASAEAFAFIPNPPVFNVSGQPSMSVPLHWSAEGLPVGMMFTARYGDEATLLRLASQLEQAHPWKDRVPPLAAGQSAQPLA